MAGKGAPLPLRLMLRAMQPNVIANEMSVFLGGICDAEDIL